MLFRALCIAISILAASACSAATLPWSCTVYATFADDGCNLVAGSVMPADSVGVVKVEATRDTVNGPVTTIYNARPPMVTLPYTFGGSASVPAGGWFVRATVNGKTQPGCVGWWSARKIVLGRAWGRAW